MNIKNEIFNNRSETEFTELALQIFRFQYENNKVYGEYIKALGIDVSSISKITEIPFLPISFFKTHPVICGDSEKYQQLFYSSSTTTGIPSKHFIKDITIYKDSFRKGFARFYGDIKQYCLFALLPSYLERGNSSLVYMINDLIKDSGNPTLKESLLHPSGGGGFYMDNYKELAAKIITNEEKKQKTLLIGVTYALLKLAEEYPMQLKNTIIMETGGMKGKREELTKQEVHKILTGTFGVTAIHSEYGMTELLSQAYSKGNGVFQCVPWMRVLIRDIYDPFHIGLVNESGAINIIDLANINSCSFIATDDIGITSPNGDFEIAGRLDSSDIRGCNLMAAEL